MKGTLTMSNRNPIENLGDYNKVREDLQAVGGNLAELYKKYSNDTNNILEEDDIAPVFAPKEDSSIEDIDLSAPKNSNFDAETPLVEPKPENDTETKSAKVESNSTENAEESSEYTAEDELLDSIDLSDLLKPVQEDDTPKDEVEAELLYGKLLNEQKIGRAHV